MKVVRFLFGVILGVGVGWVAGMLLAPKSGEDMRQTVRDRLDQIAEEGRTAAEQRVVELRAEFETAKSPRPAV
jgi:gas vesicle protein